MALLDRILCWNPLAGRYAFRQLRPRNLAIGVGMYATTLALLVLLRAAPNAGGESFEEFAEGLYGLLMGLQVLLLWVVALHASGSIIRDELQDKSIDFFRLLPISPHARIAGILVGRNLLLLLLAAFNAVQALVFGLLGGISLTRLIELGALVAAGAVALMLAALLSSTVEIRRRVQSGHVGLLVLCVFLLPYLFGAAFLWKEAFPEGAYVHFYSFEFPLLRLVTAVILYFTAWIYGCLVRRFRHERKPAFTPGGAVAFMVGFAWLAVGFLWQTLGEGGVLPLWVTLAVPLLPLAFAASRTFEDYAEEVAAGRPAPGLLSWRSNLAASFANLGIWLAAAMVLRPASDALSAWHAVVLASFGLVLLLWVEASVVCAPLTPRARHLSAFLLGLYLVLPFVLAAAVDEMALMWLSPIGHFGLLAGQTGATADSSSAYGAYGVFPAVVVPTVNLLLAGGLAALIHARYAALSARAQGRGSLDPA